MLESDYGEYKAEEGLCAHDHAKAMKNIQGASRVIRADDIIDKLDKLGPIAISIDANGDGFRYADTGIYDGTWQELDEETGELVDK